MRAGAAPRAESEAGAMGTEKLLCGLTPQPVGVRKRPISRSPGGLEPSV